VRPKQGQPGAVTTRGRQPIKRQDRLDVNLFLNRELWRPPCSFKVVITAIRDRTVAA